MVVKLILQITQKELTENIILLSIKNVLIWTSINLLVIIIVYYLKINVPTSVYLIT